MARLFVVENLDSHPPSSTLAERRWNRFHPSHDPLSLALTFGPFGGFHGEDYSGPDAHLFQGLIEMGNIRDTGLSLRAGRQRIAIRSFPPW